MQWDLCVLPGSEAVPGETIPDTIGDSTRNNDGTQDTMRAFTLQEIPWGLPSSKGRGSPFSVLREFLEATDILILSLSEQPLVQRKRTKAHTLRSYIFSAFSPSSHEGESLSCIQTH